MARSVEPPAAGPARRVLLLLNPGAGQAAALRHARRRIEEHPGLHLDLIVPDPSHQQTQYSQALAGVEAGVDAVVVCGGDGMVSAGVNLVAQREIPLGVIPAGSGNDFARAAGIPRRYEAALQRVLEALSQPKLAVRAVDALRLSLHRSDDGEAAARWAANSINIGFDARVNQRANAQRRTPRQLRYLVALAQEVPGFSSSTFEVELDAAEKTPLQSALICVQNGPTIGGGIPLAPGAQIDDGWAEVSHVGPLSRPGLVALFPLVMLRMHRWVKPLTTRRARRLSTTVPAGVPVFADGDEFLSGGADDQRVVVEVVAGAVQLLG